MAFRAAGTGILHVYDHTTASETSTGQAAEDYVAGNQIVAFRTSETPTTGSLNPDADNDTNDDVIRVWDLATDQLLETKQAVTPCNFEACDPRRPYRVSGNNVTFLTLEDDQGDLDLDGNGDANGIVIQTFNAAEALGGAGGFAPAAFSPSSGADPEVITLAGVSGGVASVTGEACYTDVDCGGTAGSCFVPPGSCIQNLGTSCRLGNACSGNGAPCQSNDDCPGMERRPRPSRLQRRNVLRALRSSSPQPHQCRNVPPGAIGGRNVWSRRSVLRRCWDSEQDIVRLFAPLTTDIDSGAQLLPLSKRAKAPARLTRIARSTSTA